MTVPLATLANLQGVLLDGRTPSLKLPPESIRTSKGHFVVFISVRMGGEGYFSFTICPATL